MSTMDLKDMTANKNAVVLTATENAIKVLYEIDRRCNDQCYSTDNKFYTITLTNFLDIPTLRRSKYICSK